MESKQQDMASGQIERMSADLLKGLCCCLYWWEMLLLLLSLLL
jgi:hypothetical protein